MLNYFTIYASMAKTIVTYQKKIHNFKKKACFHRK